MFILTIVTLPDGSEHYIFAFSRTPSGRPCLAVANSSAIVVRNYDGCRLWIMLIVYITMVPGMIIVHSLVGVYFLVLQFDVLEYVPFCIVPSGVFEG